VFDAIRELMTPPEPPTKRPIGLVTGEELPKKDDCQVTLKQQQVTKTAPALQSPQTVGLLERPLSIEIHST